MVDLIIGALESLGYPVYRQGSLTGEYPEAFFTFWNPSTEGAAYYDDAAGATLWAFAVFFYSTDPAQVETELMRAAAELRKAGFSVAGKGFDVASDEQSHTGRAINAVFREKEEV